MKIHHVGYLVKNLELSVDEFKRLGYKEEGNIVKDDIRKVLIQFLFKDNLKVELISPFDKDSDVYNLMKRYVNTPYHFCYSTKMIDEDLKKLLEGGYIIIKDKQEAPAIDGKNVIFLLNPNLGIIELLEE